MKKRHGRFSVLVGLSVGVMIGLAAHFGGMGGCGEGTGGGGGGGSGLGGATAVEGKALAANGTDPVAGAVVFVPGTPAAPLVVSGGNKSIVETDCADNGGTVSCDDPPEASCASVCSCADGSYSLDVTTCPDDSGTVKYCKGSFCGECDLNCEGDPCTCDIVGSTSSGSTADIAVVTGAFDEIEDVLAKLGFGDVDSDGKLVFGTESFAIYPCGGGRDGELFTIDPDMTTYKPCSELFGSLSEMEQYDLILINCGANEDTDFGLLSAVDLYGKEEAHILAHSKGFKAVSAAVASRLRDYVEGGGSLYVTDLAYDYVEQSIPEFMDFEPGTSSPATTAESQNEAQLGTPGITSDATVLDGLMSAWLEGRTSNTIDTASSPNFGACTTTPNGNPTSLLDASADTIRIGDFLPGWAVMSAKHTGVSPETFVWIQGPVDFSGGTDVVRPLTASKRQGDGCVLYSSYHSSHSCPTTGFWPQERVLQYLVFETAGSCTP